MADSGHARIVRLSLIQGDVRFAREFHKDALDDSKANWEVAPLNLPIRQGYALATDSNGRAEVAFDNGAMAFLSPNTVIEFYDLSLDDGALITRLVLRQGSAIFYVHPAKEDFFSVTGGDFSVEANGRARFRLDNYDDGSLVNVEQGHVSVLRGKETKALEQGQSYAINVNDGGGNPVIDRNPDSDDFDKWVSGRIDNVATATVYANQYVNSPTYSSGFADLYNYGSWYSIAGYGYGWQPYGMGLGWSPFAFGSWYYDPFFGWNFIGSAAWGWLPYHYGGWVFSPVYGWVWIPTGFGLGGPVHYRPITAVWVHSGGVTGLVPLHPADLHGKPPLNLHQGVYAVHGNAISTTAVPSAGEKWALLHPSREALTATALAPAPVPTRVSRTIPSGKPVTLSRDSFIFYDAGQHRFVNSNEPPKTSVEAAKTIASSNVTKESVVSTGAGGPPAKPNAPIAVRTTVPRPPTPPPSTHSSHSSGGAVWSGRSSGSVGGATASSHTSTGSSSHGSGGHH